MVGVLHFAPSFLPTVGGMEIMVHHLALRQRAAVMCPAANCRALAGEVPYPLIPIPRGLLRAAVAAGPLGGLARWAMADLVARAAARFDLPVVHVHAAFAGGFVTIPGLARRGVPTVLTCHGADITTLPDIGYGYRLARRLDRGIGVAVRTATRTVAISRGMGAILSAMKVGEDRLRHVANGTDVGRIAAVPAERAAMREQLGWPADLPVLITVGRNHPKKGYHLIPDIAARLAAAGRPFLWVLVGRGCEPVLEAARARGLGDRIRLAGQVAADPGQRFDLPSDSLVRMLKVADLFVFPTRLEGLPLVLAEAMAAGLPVVTTDAIGCEDVVGHGRNGLISPVGDAAAMAGNLESLLADPALAEAMRRQNPIDAMRFDWPVVVEAYGRVYDEALSAARGGERPCHAKS